MKIFIVFIISILLIAISNANGGCMKIADDVLVQLSSSPLVSVVDKETSFLISFADIQKELIKEEINGELSILKNNGIILKKDFKIKGGILDLKHTFKNLGVYEIFLEFNFKNKTYAPEDFLIEVKGQKNDFMNKIIFLLIGIFIGIILMKFVKKQK